MASQSAIAEGGGIVTADQINYQQKMFSHPNYRFEPQFPNTFGLPINLGAGQIPVTINIPPTVFNLAQSYLLYTVTLPLVALSYIWTPEDTLSEIAHIQFYGGSGTYIADIDNLQNYLSIIMKKETELDEFLSMDALNQLYPNNSLVNIAPALKNSTIANINTPGGVNNPSSVNYTEPAYFSVGGLAAPVTYNVQFPLRLIKNSIFSMDKNMYFGQTTYLKQYFGTLSKIAYTSNSNAGPSAGTKASYVAAGTITNLQLMLAEESNVDLRTSIIKKVTDEGMSMLIPYIQAFKNSNTGVSQNISIQFDQGYGRSLLKVIHAPFNSLEDLDCMYDHQNTSVIGATNVDTNLKCSQYYTQLNGKRNQDITIDCTNTVGTFTDYMSHRKMLRRSVLQNLQVYKYNWFHCDDFTDFGAKYDQDNNGELISGIPMSVAPLTWSFIGAPMAAINNTFQHYTWAIFVKKLTVMNGQLAVE